MTNYRVEMDRAMCISCGNCIDACPDLWKFGDDGISSLIDSKMECDIQIKELDDLGCSVDAAGRCPVICIHVYEGEIELV